MRLTTFLLSLTLLLSSPACDEFRPSERAPEHGPSVAMRMSVAPGDAATDEESGYRDKTMPANLKVTLETDRKLIRNGHLAIRVDDAEAAAEEATRIAHRVGGLVSDSRIASSEPGHRSATLTLRVPAASFDQAVDLLAALGRVDQETTGVEDVTLAYLDLETRLRVKRDTEIRLREILRSRTGSVEQVLKVEREIGRVVEEIERMEALRRQYDRQVAMATIALEIYEQPAVVQRGMLAPIGRALRGSVDVLIQSVAFLVYVVVFIVPWLLLAALAWWIGHTVRSWARAGRVGASRGSD